MKTFKVTYQIPASCLKPYEYFVFTNVEISIYQQAKDIKAILEQAIKFAKKEGWTLKTIEEDIYATAELQS